MLLEIIQRKEAFEIDVQIFKFKRFDLILGDEGGAWWIAQLAMKVWFDDEDKLNKAPYPTTKVAEVIKTYFNVQDRFGLLTYCYDQFEKDHFAGVCKSLAESAAAQDPLSQWIFTEAGKVLAKHIVALSSSMPNSLHKSLSVVCIGSGPFFLLDLTYSHDLK